MPTLQVIESPAALADAVAAQVERAAAEAVAARGRFALALPGGSVATACFPRLVTARVDWANTEVFFAHERASARQTCAGTPVSFSCHSGVFSTPSVLPSR